MNSIDFETLVTVIFVLVDDWYQLEGKTLRENLPGAKPIMSDSEILTLALIMDYLPFPGETQFIGFIRELKAFFMKFNNSIGHGGETPPTLSFKIRVVIPNAC